MAEVERTPGFVDYMLQPDIESKAQLFNTIQYAVLALLPLALLTRVSTWIVPEFDNTKGGFEMLAECAAHMALLAAGIWATDRLIRYAPTYSGLPYPAYNGAAIVVPIAMVLIAVNNRLGDKVSAVIARLIGDESAPAAPAPVQTRSRQPIVPPQREVAPQQLLPDDRDLTAMPDLTAEPETAPSIPDFSMPMPGSHASEPLAANDFGGGLASWVPN